MKLLISVTLFLLSSVSCVKAVTVQACPMPNGSLIYTEIAETVTLVCMTDNSSDASNQNELQWYRNGAMVKLKEENRLYRSSLCVYPVTREDNGAVFICQLKGNASVNSTIELEVKFAPDLNTTENISVEEQSDLVLSCDVRANPPVTVAWMKNGEVLDLTTGGYKSSNDGKTAQLSIPNIKRLKHQGTYMCETTSSIYGIRSKNFEVKVIDKVLKFPLGPTIAGLAVVACTMVLALISRRDKIKKCFKGN